MNEIFDNSDYHAFSKQLNKELQLLVEQASKPDSF